MTTPNAPTTTEAPRSATEEPRLATEARRSNLHVIPSARYLVTGGGGFIGSNIVEALVDARARVRVLDDFSTGRLENLDGPSPKPFA